MFELPKKIKMIAAALTIVGLGLLVIGFNTDYSQASDGHDDHAVAQNDNHAALSAHGDYPGEAHAAMIQSTIEDSHDDHGAARHARSDAATDGTVQPAVTQPTRSVSSHVSGPRGSEH